MSVHYKFKSAVEYDTLPVDGLNISLGDLKEAIIQQKRLGKGQPFDLQITNAETKEVYTDEKTLIPKNSSLIVARVPIDPSQMKRPWENLKDATALILANPANIMNTEDAAEAAEIDRKIKEVTDLTLMEGSEQDKINAMVAQSTIEYHPSKYVKLRASKMTGSVPIGYRCYKCNQSGHWVTMCPLNNQDLRKSTGIPSMFLEEVKDPNTPGVMISATGKLVRLRDMVTNEKAAKVSAPSESALPPEELQCRLCNDLMKDAVLVPCCAAAFCDDCIRNHLLDSEEHVCPACQKEGIGPDTLIPNRYLRIKVQQFECGCFYGEKKTDGASDGGETLSSVPTHVLKSANTPTPPLSPANSKSPNHSASPAKSRINEKFMASPVSLASLSPMHGSSPSRVIAAEPFGNGDIGSDKENIVAQGGCETKDAVSTQETDPSGIPAENETLCALEEKENIEVNEGDSDIDGKPKKVKKKKAKRKNSRHEEEGESDERERKKRERKSSHRSQERLERKSKRRDMELLKDVDDLPADKADLWDDDRVIDNISLKHDDLTPKKKKKHRNKDLVLGALDSEEEHEKVWNDDRPVVDRVESSNRSRSNSGDKERETPAVYVPFNPLVPPPNFVKSPTQDYTYPVTSTFVSPVVPPIPVTSVTTYPHYQPGIPPPALTNPPLSYPGLHSSYPERELIADPLAEFEKHLREKDERAARRQRYSRSRSPSRSPRYRRGRSRSRQRTWSRSRSRSRSRSISRPRGVVSTHSPRSPSRRRWSRSPPPRGHASYRSRSPSFARDRSVSNRSLSLSRTPSPNRRIMSPSVPILPIHQPVHPEVLLARPPPSVDYGVPRDYTRYPMGSLPQDQYPPQPGYPPPNPHWDARYNQGLPDAFKTNFVDQRGRGGRGRRGRGAGFRQGNNYGYDQRGQEYRHQYDRQQHMPGDRHGIPSAVWDREGRQSYTVELPRSDRVNRYSDSERRRYADEFEDVRPRRDAAENVRRHDEGHAHVYSSDDEWRRYSDDGKKRDEDPDRRKYEGRRGHEDRKEDPDSRRVSDVDEFEDLKRSRKDNDGRKSFERRYKDTDDGRSNRHEREGKHRSGTHRDSPKDEELHYRSKPYDSPAKSHKKSSPKDRRDRDTDRKERDVEKRNKESDRKDKDSDKKDRDSDRRERENDKRERDIDKRDREGDRRVKDNERRDRDADRRERDDRRDRDYDKQERDVDRREKEYDRKDSYRRDREQDRKSRDADKKDKDADRRDRDSSRREKELVNKDKSERNDDDHRRDRDGERSYSSRWDHGDMRIRSEKEMDSKSRSQEREGSLATEERDHKRKSKRKEEKEDGHHKDKGDDPDTEKVEKKKHEKKKKKKEKRRASQASTEVSQGELSGDEGEDKKKKKKRDKKKKAKGATSESLSETTDSSKPLANDDPSVGNGVSTEPLREIVPRADDEDNSEMVPREQTPNPEPKEASPSTLLRLPPLSKWERDEELTLTPKGLVESKTPEEEKKVTDDILKRAENTIQVFSGRGLANRKVFLDHQKQKESDEREKSPTPEWERLETREAKRRGTSIQITISSKTESQIGRPRSGRHQQASPERVDDKKYPSRTRRSTDTDNKTEKNSRAQKRSQSPSESESVTKTRRKSEKEEHTKEEKDFSGDALTEASDFKKVKSMDVDQDQKSLKGEFDTDIGMPAKCIIKEDVGQSNLLDTKLKSEVEGASEHGTLSCATLQEDSKVPDLSDKLMKEENVNVPKGVKRSSPSSDESEVKKLKLNDEFLSSEASETVETMETLVDFGEGKHFHSEGEAEFAVAELGGNISEVKNQVPVAHANSNLVPVAITSAKAEDLEEGEITTDSSGDDAAARQPPPETASESNSVVQSNNAEEPPKTPSKIRHSPIRVPSPVEPSKSKETMKTKEKNKKRKKRKRSSSSSSSNSSSSSSSSSSSEDEEIVKKKKKKKKKKKAVDTDSSDGESQKKHKKKKKEKKKKKKKDKKKKSDK